MQPDDLRAHLNDLAARLEGASADPSVRWAVIRGIEQAWDGEPGKVREQNRRSVLKYLTGQDSTKALSDAHILALHEHLQDFDVWSDFRAVLRAQLVAAGQLELPAQ